MYCYTNANWNYNLKDIPVHSLGYELFDYNRKTGIGYKPNLTRHDLKHILKI